MSEDKKAFRYISGQAWVEMDEPSRDYLNRAGQAEEYQKQVQAYNNRLHFDVVPQPAEWEEGRLIIEGVDFKLEEQYTGIISGGLRPIGEIGGKGLHHHSKQVAIPIQPTMKEERKFTLDEMLECWEAADWKSDTYKKYKGITEYFKEKFNIDL